jgi:hypothetical protein
LPSCLLCFFPARESASAGRIWRPMIKPNMQCSRCRRQGEPNAVGGRARKGMQSPTCAIAEMRVGWMMGLSPWWCGPMSFGEMSSNPRLRVTDGHSCRSFHLQAHPTSLAAPRIIPSHLIQYQNTTTSPKLLEMIPEGGQHAALLTLGSRCQFQSGLPLFAAD